MATRVAELEAGTFEGEAARNFEIVSESGFRATFNAVGARLMALHYPDGFDIVAGPERIEDMLESDIYAGAICGRFANRIGNGRFMLNDKERQLTQNLPPHHLHGGVNGFHRKNWVSEIEDDALVFSLVSKSQEEGYPGRFRARAVYRFDDDILSLDIEARTRRPTIVNLTNHAYWNLSGAKTITNHVLQISAQAYTPTDQTLIPTGAVSFVSGTNYDFREPTLLEEAFGDDQGFDTNFCLEGPRYELHHAATLMAQGREFDLFTTEPGLQLYTAGHHGPELKGKNGQPLRRFGSIALEPQNWPDAPNHPNFPSAVLKQGEVYHHRMEWRFRQV
ncbi:aldose epimerase family protein [Taklimakanibacter deserti]|uniref:aldose epimerase family protein n=1 Tax=Taklimakanibacter deserti TaxID=2267839 RepID=UPI000E6540D0